MNSAGAIFMKQLQDLLKNSGVLVQFVIFPFMAFMMTHLVTIDMGGAFPESFFITTQAAMFVGMTLISTTATAIAEDREKNSLRFLLMAGVKSHEYLLGVGGVIFVCAMVINILFVIMMPGISIIESLTMFASMMLGTTASILLGATIGMKSENEQVAISMSSAAGMFLGFGPMIATLSGNETLDRVFGLFYTKNFVYEDIRTTGALQSFGVILANVVVLAVAFAWVYGKQESSKKGGIIMNKKVMAAMLTLTLLGGAGIGVAIWHNAGFLATDNARVTTTLISVTANVPGVLERFAIYEGQRVREDEILGWVENGEAMRSPVDGLVIQTNAVQNQFVSQIEPIAVIADLNNLHIQANIEETDISNVQLGQRVYVTIDGFGNRQFIGYVSNIGNITQAEIAGNAFNTSTTFTRRTHLIPIEINIVEDINLDNIIGVNAKVRIPIR